MHVSSCFTANLSPLLHHPFVKAEAKDATWQIVEFDGMPNSIDSLSYISLRVQLAHRFTHCHRDK